MTVIHHLTVMAQGGTPVWTSPDLGLGEPMPCDLVESALALDRAASDTLNGVGPWLEKIPDVPGLFSDLQEQGVLAPTCWLDALKSASIEELEGARRLARAITNDFVEVVSAIEILEGRDAFGWGHFRSRTQLDGDSINQKVLLVAGCVLLLRLMPSDGVSSFVEAVAAVAPDARKFVDHVEQADPDIPTSEEP